MDPIRTTSGKTARAQIAELRQKRAAIQRDPTDELVEHLDALAEASYAKIRADRDHNNRLRPLIVAAKQAVMAVRKLRKLDVEL